LSLTLINARSILPIPHHLLCVQPNGPQVVKEGCGDYVSRMRVTLNGEPRSVRDGLTVAELVDDLGLRARRIAVEINLDILAREDYPCRALHDGDVVEIVHFIGGG
jgi:thiamine biosynthesis protein ThiS